MASETPNGSAASSPTREDGPSRKRRRTRTGIACDSCQRRKTRCELLDGDGVGCHRCQVLGTTCSLLPDLASGLPRSESSFDTDRMRNIDERTERMEKALSRMTARAAGSGEGVVERPNDTGELFCRHGGTGPMVLRAFRQSLTSKWIDPVELGLVSERQIEQCVQQYCDQTALTFPVDSVINLIKRHSDHPLVRNAVLLYTMPHLRPRLNRMLQVNLGVADATQSSISIFVGFLVLSQIPQTREELVTSIDVHSAAIRGMGQAMAIGLDDVVHAVSQVGFDWEVETECVERLAALYLIAHRLAWTHSFSTPGFTHQMTLPLLINIVPIATAVQLRSRLLLHLTLESILLTLLDPVVQALRRARLERPFQDQSIQSLLHAFNVFQTKLVQWRADVAFNNLSSCPFLLFHSYLVELSLAVVLSGLYIPTPVLYANRMEIVTTFGGELLHASLAGIHHVIDSDLDLSLIPSFHLVLALLPLGALVQSGKLHPGAEEVADRKPALDRYRRVLSRSHPRMALMVQDLDEMAPPHDYTTFHKDHVDEDQPVYPEWDLGLEQLFDLDSLWPMLNEFSGGGVI